MRQSASDAVFTDLATVSLTLLTTIFGTVRGVFERGLTMAEGEAIHRQLILMCSAYPDAIRAPGNAGRHALSC